MIYVEALDKPVDPNAWCLFLAGGITDCPDWQAELVDMLKDTGLTLLNPRRKNFPIHDHLAAHEQITWEHEMLKRANAISFWFPKETLCPIVLYELGAWSVQPKQIFVGAEKGYKRLQDVRIQTSLARPSVHITESLDLLQAQIKDWCDRCTA